MVSEVKTCKECGEVKPREQFPKYNDKSKSANARRSRCRPCFNRRREEKRRASPMSLASHNAAKRNRYRSKHGIPVNAPVWSQKNGKPVGVENEASVEANRIKARLRYWDRKGMPLPTDKVFIDGRWKLPPEEAECRIKENNDNHRRGLKGRFNAAKRGAKRRDLEWTISFEDFERLSKEPCYYWAAHPKPIYGSGLDRIDNAKGYTLENVLPCCGPCNMSKQDKHSVEEWKVMVVAKETFLLKKQEELSVESNQPQRSIS